MYGNGSGYNGNGGWGVPQQGRGFYQPSSNNYGQPFNQFVGGGQQDIQNNFQKPTLQIPWVNGEVGARAYIIPPNSAVLLMDSDNNRFYIKSSDANGRATIETFDYARHSEEAVDTSQFITRAEYNSLKQSVENLQQSINGGKNTTAEDII